MLHINKNYKNLQASYLFADINRRIAEFQKEHPDRKLIKLGIGDFTKALPGSCVKAFHRGVDDLARDESFRGYGPEQGYDFLRSVIAENDYRAKGIDISSDEIFISDGAKCDTGNFQELFDCDAVIAVQDPVYPVYVDTNVMAGRSGKWKNGRYEDLIYLESSEENNFVPAPPDQEADLIYLCFPNNPTGSVITKEALARWVDYARDHGSLILYDAAYVAYIRAPEIPHSIFEIPGAKEVAVEFRSFSKTAGFTGTRCAFAAIPRECVAKDREGTLYPIRDLWNRRQTTKFNGASYPVQRAAEAAYSAEGKRECKDLADYFLDNARIIRENLEEMGIVCTGGVNSPYIWAKAGRESWSFFELLLNDAGIVCTPGSGFGKCGEGFVRFSAFNEKELVSEAIERISNILA